MTNKIEEIPAEKARINFARLLREASREGKIFVITVHGNPVATLGRWTPESNINEETETDK